MRTSSVNLPETIIVWYNPGSTNARRTVRLVAQIRAQFRDVTVEVVSTQPGSYEKNQQQLKAAIKNHPEPLWLIVGGGDGTISSALNVMRELHRDVPLLPFAAGNSNDIASILHGRLQRAFRGSRLLHAKQIPITPLECTITQPDGTTFTRYGVTYISFGITAHTARTINAPSHRNAHRHTRTANRLKRRIHEIRTFIRILNAADIFHLEEDGTNHALYERMFINGQRMAKYFRWPVLLTESAFHDIKIDSLKPKDNMQNMRKMASGHLYGTRFRQGEDIAFTTHSDIVGQLDGETIQLHSGTHIKIALARKPSTFMSVR